MVCIRNQLGGRKRPHTGSANKAGENRRHQTAKRREKERVPRADIKPPYRDRLSKYDSEKVQHLWEDAIELDLKIEDPYYAQNDAQYESMMNAAKEMIKRKKKTLTAKYTFNRAPFRRAPYYEQKVVEQLIRFESRMARIQHSVCPNCMECSLNMSVRLRDSVCARCRRKETAESNTLSNKMLPIWYDDVNKAQYHVPSELSCLTIAEILLIQRVSPLVPIVHIRNGTMGLKGHVCSFQQDVNSVATSLPKLPEHVKAVRMVRTYKDAEGNMQMRSYMVNRHKVMRALKWLVSHHVDYKRAHENGELSIDESNLNWMGDELEAELPTITELTRTYDFASDVDGEVDYGVSKKQVCDPEDGGNGEVNESSGIACPDNANLINEAQDAALRALKEAAEANSSISVLDWPQQSREAISEFGDERIFANAFPHLFPGGIADIDELERHTEITPTNWAKHLLHYYDGRFARDPIWPFFAYNYILRKKNVSSGSFFVKSHISSPPRTIDALKEQLRKGDSSFVSKIMFFSKKTRGTDSYWRHKRAELYNWIHYHIAAGNGAPNVFLTLSCAEYFWADMIRLLEERVWMSEGGCLNGKGQRCHVNGSVIDFSTNITARNKAVNDYSIVVQEFFIKRLQDWLDTVGKAVLGINHYWCRMEFAKGRGQIHAHLIAILDKNIVRDLQNDLNLDHQSSMDEAKIVGNWAEKQFGLSAKLSPTDSSVTPNQEEQGASTMRMGEVVDYRLDESKLCHECQIHTCSKYCMRCKKGSKKQRYCRAGAGNEVTPNMCDTPGFQRRDESAIVRDDRNFLKLEMPRNHLRFHQTSLHVIRGWRGNCDLKILIYSNPTGVPSPDEISEVTDYVCAYCCKGNETLAVERETLRDFILSSEGLSGDQDDVIKISRQILNRGVAHRTVPKQECMVELAELPLVLCTELTETINLSGSYKLTGDHKSYLSKYRKLAPYNPKLSLHQYVCNRLRQKQGSKKTIIPHYVGASGQPKYPPTPQYAMAVLIVYKPWGASSPPQRSNEEMVSDFLQFIESTECPVHVSLEYARVKERVLSKRPEAFSSEECYDREIQPDMDRATQEMLSIVTNVTHSTDPFFSISDHSFDRGLNYDWSQRMVPNRDELRQGGVWLESEIAKHRAVEQKYRPFKFCARTGEEREISIDMAKGDQLRVMVVIMRKIREWITCATSPSDRQAAKFVPLRMTLRGSAGAGKSFFIKCLCNTVTKIFGGNSVVEIAGPTGAAAYNVGGETLHRKWGISPHHPQKELSQKMRERLRDVFKRTLVIIVDERSMLTAPVVGAAERNTSLTAHGGSHDDEEWGGVPIVIFVGDDYQLPPPTNKEKGAFDLMGSRPSYSQQRFGVASSGAYQLMKMADMCMELTTVKRQNEDQRTFKGVLERLRLGETTRDDAAFLTSLHTTNFSTLEMNQILGKGVTMHIFATKAPMNEHNYHKLAELSSKINPVAMLKTRWVSTNKKLSKASIMNHFKDPPPTATMIARGAIVKNVDKNFEPGWGLFNNAVGEVEEIVFDKDHADPNSGDLPACVAVKYAHYCGPVWDQHNDKVVPIPMVTLRCDHNCCTATFCPLELSFGMTAHTFQGQSAGPVNDGQPRNAVDRIIADPGTRGFEGTNPGTSYMICSRATTTGSSENRLDSALYFSGPNAHQFRFLNLKYKKACGAEGKLQMYKKVALRQKWVEFLDANTFRDDFTKEEIREIIKWCIETVVPTEVLDAALSNQAWRENSRH